MNARFVGLNVGGRFQLLLGLLLQDLFGDIVERSRDIDIRFGARLNERDAVTARHLLAAFGAHDSLVLHVALVSHDHLDHVLIGVLEQVGID